MPKDSLDFNTFPTRVIRANLTKNISFSHNLFFENTLKNKNIVIDKNLSILSTDDEKEAISIFNSFLINSRQKRNISGTYFLYQYDGELKHYFEAEDKVRLFTRAVRIYKNKECDALASFPIENSTYYHIFDIFNSTKNNDLFSEDFSYIKSEQELEDVKKIYFNLEKAKLDQNFGAFSKIHNAVTFYDHFYQQQWVLQKTALAFTSLESLFSDYSKSEVTYKIALRTSYFLYPDDKAKRLDLFKFIKRAYDIRSYFIHGSDVEKQINKIMKKIKEERKLDEYSFYNEFKTELDSIVSKCLAKILLNEKYFLFFSKEKLNPEEETEFYDTLVMS
jgi:hypothetical protein